MIDNPPNEIGKQPPDPNTTPAPSSRTTIRSLLSSVMFHWANPLIEAGNDSELTFEKMPELTREFYHQNYSNKIRHFFKQLRRQTDISKSYYKKTFISHLILRTFKWDIAIGLLLALAMQLFEYSTAFFIQQILAIKKGYDPDDYVKMFALFSGAMVVCKVCSALFSQYTAYFTVGSLGFAGKQKHVRTLGTDTRKDFASIAESEH